MRKTAENNQNVLLLYDDLLSIIFLKTFELTNKKDGPTNYIGTRSIINLLLIIKGLLIFNCYYVSWFYLSKRKLERERVKTVLNPHSTMR